MITLRFTKQDALDALTDVLYKMHLDEVKPSDTCRSICCVCKDNGIVIEIYKRADITTRPHPVFDDDKLPF